MLKQLLRQLRAKKITGRGEYMQERIVEAFNENFGNSFKSFDDIKCEYSVTEILDV